MAKGILVHRSDSKYDDFPEERYQFPKRYLKRMTAFAGDWIVYYEPRSVAGRIGYLATAKIAKIVPDPAAPDMYLALIEPRTYIPFEHFVPWYDGQRFMESMLEQPDGSLNRGRIQWAVRPISDDDFLKILATAFPTEISFLPRTEPVDLPEHPAQPALYEDQVPYVHEGERQRVDRTIALIDRSRVFRRHVLAAYDSRCAITDLRLINGGGRAEVEAAHIKPVSHNGPDVVRNGLALSGTVHWMFDRGLLGVGEDAEILISRQANDPEQIRNLIRKPGRIRLPEDEKQHPHPAFLAWHRENIFKH